MLASRAQESMLLRMLYNGVAGCLLKDTDLEELMVALRRVHSGHPYLSPRLEGRPPERRLDLWRSGQEFEIPDPLTGRERELLQLVGEGYTNREIAEQLCLSVKTVEAHKSNICSKLNLRSGMGLMVHAIHAGMVAI